MKAPLIVLLIVLSGIAQGANKRKRPTTLSETARQRMLFSEEVNELVRISEEVHVEQPGIINLDDAETPTKPTLVTGQQ